MLFQLQGLPELFPFSVDTRVMFGKRDVRHAVAGTQASQARTHLNIAAHPSKTKAPLFRALDFPNRLYPYQQPAISGQPESPIQPGKDTVRTSHICSKIDAQSVSASIRREASLRHPRKDDKALT